MSRAAGGSASPAMGPRTNPLPKTREEIIESIARKYVSRFGKEEASCAEIRRCVDEYIRQKPEPLKLTRKDFVALDLMVMKRVHHAMKRSNNAMEAHL